MPSRAEPKAPASPSHEETPSLSPPDLSAELALIWEARKLVSSDPVAAEIALEKHAQSFPEGAMSLERDVLLVEALERRGLHDQAVIRARALLARSTPSIYEARLRRVVDAAAR
jgi:hypothetical protein